MVTRDRMWEALARLGVRSDTLTTSERRSLDRDGYLMLPGVLSRPEVVAVAERLDAVLRAEGSDAGQEVGRQEPDVERVCDLVNKGAEFTVCFQHPRVLAAIEHVVGPRFKLSSLNGRVVLPGGGPQPLHEDWHAAVEPDDYYACNSLWMLDDFTSTNGATRVVPASHRGNRRARDALVDPDGPHPDEVLLTGEAGSVVIFNAHLWHGGTLNRSSIRRRALLSFFCWRGQRQQQRQSALLRPETAARLCEASRLILDLD